MLPGAYQYPGTLSCPIPGRSGAILLPCQYDDGDIVTTVTLRCIKNIHLDSNKYNIYTLHAPAR